MINKTCSCKRCGTDNLYYQMPTNLVFKVMALNVFWCHKCESKNYYWAWNLSKAY
jgi:Zn finger protein HypA/HybF involved in hydrogenase expression